MKNIKSLFSNALESVLGGMVNIYEWAFSGVRELEDEIMLANLRTELWSKMLTAIKLQLECDIPVPSFNEAVEEFQTIWQNFQDQHSLGNLPVKKVQGLIRELEEMVELAGYYGTDRDKLLELQNLATTCYKKAYSHRTNLLAMFEGGKGMYA